MLDRYDEDEAPQKVPDRQDFYGADIKINEAKVLLTSDKPLTLLESIIRKVQEENVEKSLGSMDPNLRSETLHVFRGQHIMGNTLLSLRKFLQDWVDQYEAQQASQS